LDHEITPLAQKLDDTVGSDKVQSTDDQAVFLMVEQLDDLA
jgi:hypothetical protein